MRNRKRHIQNFKIFFNVSYFCRVMRTEQYNYRWVQEPNRFIHTLNINSKASYDQYTFMVVEQNKYEQIILPPFSTNFHIVTIVLSDWQQHLMRTEESPCRISFIIMIFFFHCWILCFLSAFQVPHLPLVSSLSSLPSSTFVLYPKKRSHCSQSPKSWWASC